MIKNKNKYALENHLNCMDTKPNRKPSYLAFNHFALKQPFFPQKVYIRKKVT